MKNSNTHSRMKMILMACAVGAVMLGSIASPEPEPDFFGEGSSPKEIILAAWERLIVFPHGYQNRAVELSGWLRIDDKPGEFTIALYKDEESMKLYRPQSCVLVHPSANLLKAYKDGNKGEWAKLSGRYALVTCYFRSVPKERVGRVSHVGILFGPYYLDVETTASKPHIMIRSQKQNWNHEETDDTDPEYAYDKMNPSPDRPLE